MTIKQWKQREAIKTFFMPQKLNEKNAAMIFDVSKIQIRFFSSWIIKFMNGFTLLICFQVVFLVSPVINSEFKSFFNFIIYFSRLKRKSLLRRWKLIFIVESNEFFREEKFKNTLQWERYNLRKPKIVYRFSIQEHLKRNKRRRRKVILIGKVSSKISHQ